MRVIVCGGRHFDDWDAVKRHLDHIHKETPITMIVHGCASGADSLASKWAFFNQVRTHRFPANWKDYGRSAGPRRNQQMANSGADLLVAFPGGKGTQNMVNICRKKGIKVLDFNMEPI